MNRCQTDIPYGLEGKRGSGLPKCPEPKVIINSYSKVRTKNDVIRNFLSFARYYFQNVAVFAVYPDYRIQLVGSVGARIRQVGERLGSIALDRATVFRRVVANNYPYHGRFPVGEEERVTFNNFTLGLPDEIWIWPASVGDTVDFLFYAEQPIGYRQNAVEKFEYLLQKTILVLKLLFVRKQLKTI